MPEAVYVALEAAGAYFGTEMVLTAGQLYFASQAIVYTATIAAAGAMQRRAENKARNAANASLKDREVMIRSGIAPRRTIYGRDRVSGPVVFAQSTGAKGEYLHLVIALAAHECDAIETVYFNDVALPDGDVDGNINSGEFAKSVVAPATYAGTTSAGGVMTLPMAAARVIVVSTPVSGNLYNGTGGDMVSGWAHTAGSASVTGLPASTDFVVDYESTSTEAVVRVRKFIGAAGQVADPDLVTESAGKWTSAHKGVGICYLYVRLKFDPDVFGQLGIPNISAVVRGKKVLDPRTSTTAWTENAALIAADWLQDTTYGLRAAAPEVPSAEVIAAANICDEAVTIATAVTQARYTFGGSFTSDMAPRDVLEDLLTGMAGTCVWTQGRWLLRPGAYRTPDLTITADHLAGNGVTIRPRASRAELFNAVRATYRDPGQGWAEVQAPLVTNSTYQAEDGGTQVARSIRLPGVMDSMRAQRLAKIELERGRQAVTVQLATSMRGYNLAPTDTCTLQLSRYGWGAGKVFEVRERTFSPEGAVAYVLRETVADVYAWNMGEATVIDPAPDTALPSPYAAIAAPASLTATSGTDHLVAMGDGTLITRAYVEWAQCADAFVTSGGKVELRWRKPGDTDWQPVAPADGAATAAYIDAVPDGIVILIGARFVNAVGRASAWSTLGHAVVGKTALPADVTGFSAVVATGGIALAWDSCAELDYVETEIRHGASWAAGATIYRGRAVAFDWLWPAAGSYTLRAKHRDGTGNVSAGGTPLVITVTANALLADLQSAMDDAAAAQATADGKIDSYYQAAAPGSANEGDLWFDTDNGNLQYRWTSGVWVSATDTRIGQALSDASDAQATADGKVVTFVSASAPTAEGVGDLWLDSNDGNKLYRWTGGAWVALQLGTSAIVASAATEVYVETGSAPVTVTGEMHTPDGFSAAYNTVIETITFTPAADGTATIYVDAVGEFTNSDAVYNSYARWSLQDDGGAWDGWKRLSTSIGPGSVAQFPIQSTRRFAVTGGVSYSISLYAAKFHTADTFFVTSVEMRAEVIKL